MSRARVGTAWASAAMLTASLGLAGCDPETDSDFDPKPPPSRDAELSVLQYNVHQGKSGHVMAVLADTVEREKPDVVTLNELCETDYESSHSGDGLLPVLEELGYTGHFMASKSTLNCVAIGGDVKQGVAVFVKAGSASHSVSEFDIGQGTPCLEVSGESPFAACATHLSAGPKSARREAKELRSEMNGLAATMPVVFAGDLNLDPWDAAIGDLYGDFRELDELELPCGTGDDQRPVADATNPPPSCTFWHVDKEHWRKLDYVLVDKRHFESDVDAKVIDVDECGPDRDEECSDHRMMLGTARLIDPDSAPKSTEPSNPNESAPAETNETEEGPTPVQSSAPPRER